MMQLHKLCKHASELEQSGDRRGRAEAERLGGGQRWPEKGKGGCTMTGLNSLTPGHSPCPLQNRRSLTTSSKRTLQMAASVHPSPLWEPLCSSSRRRLVHFTLYRTIGS